MNKREQIARIIVAPDARSDADVSLIWNTVSNIVREQALRTADRILEMFDHTTFTFPEPETPHLTWRNPSHGIYISEVFNDTYFKLTYHRNSGNRDGRDYSVTVFCNGTMRKLVDIEKAVTLTDAKRIAQEHYDKTLPVLRS